MGLCYSPSPELTVDEPHYMLTRLLLRRQGKIHPFSALLPAYSAELGEEGVARAIAQLVKPLSIPHEILESEAGLQPESSTMAASRAETKPIIPITPQSEPSPRKRSAKSLSKQRRKPWADLSTGMSTAEETADPDLAEAIRESLWAAKVGRIEIDEDGARINTPPPERPGSSRTPSDSSTSSSSSDRRSRIDFDEDFSLKPKPPPIITLLARDHSTLNLDEIMSCISADDLRKVARVRKVPSHQLLNRAAVCAALRSLARKQTVLGFTPNRSKAGQGTLPFAAKQVTSESLLVTQLMPFLGDVAIQLSAPLHNLVSRVNLIFSRTPPISGSSASLMLPSILVTSHRRRYPNYGAPTRSLIWNNRDDLLTWERAVHWEAVVGDALGDSWAEYKRNATPGWGRKEMLGRIDGARVVKRIWEGMWPIWTALVEGAAGMEVDPANEKSGVAGDRFKTGEHLHPHLMLS